VSRHSDLNSTLNRNNVKRFNEDANQLTPSTKGDLKSGLKGLKSRVGAVSVGKSGVAMSHMSSKKSQYNPTSMSIKNLREAKAKQMAQMQLMKSFEDAGQDENMIDRVSVIVDANGRPIRNEEGYPSQEQMEYNDQDDMCEMRDGVQDLPSQSPMQNDRLTSISQVPSNVSGKTYISELQKQL